MGSLVLSLLVILGPIMGFWVGWRLGGRVSEESLEKIREWLTR